jgi:hypothetical protein
LFQAWVFFPSHSWHGCTLIFDDLRDEKKKRPKAGAIAQDAVAIKKGQNLGQTFGFQEMGSFRCEGCGEEFQIRHHPTVADPVIATRQVHWLEKVLADEHDRQTKHPDRIQLPD